MAMNENQTINTHEVLTDLIKSMQSHSLGSLVFKSSGACAGGNVQNGGCGQENRILTALHQI